MARDLAVPQVQHGAEQGGGDGGGFAGSSPAEGGNFPEGSPREGRVCPPSPDRLQYSSSEESGGEEGDGEALYRDFLARRLQEEGLESRAPRRQQQEQSRRSRSRVEEEQARRSRSRVEQDQAVLQEDLATLAQRFQGSAEREEVRRRAEGLDLASLSQVRPVWEYVHLCLVDLFPLQFTMLVWSFTFPSPLPSHLPLLLHLPI